MRRCLFLFDQLCDFMLLLLVFGEQFVKDVSRHFVLCKLFPQTDLFSLQLSKSALQDAQAFLSVLCSLFASAAYLHAEIVNRAAQDASNSVKHLLHCA